jgi:putative thiamine transport system ATP-binding protein
MSGLTLADVRIALPDRPLLGPLDLAVAPGSVATVMGPSGSGKSTLLAFVAGFLRAPFAARGRVSIDGEDITAVPPERRRAGLLFQDALLFPHLSVGGNLAFGLDPGVRGRAARRYAVEEALAQAGLAGLADRDPATLSGGQRTRVALMRCLLARPRMLLLDEPFSALDASLRADIRAFVFNHVRERNLPALLVTHDETDAAAAGGPVVGIG